MTRVVFLFAPGAGAPSTSPWMERYRRRLEALAPVRTLDYPYAKAGRRAPDPLPRLIEAHRAELSSLRSQHPEAGVVLIGKSMGGRVGCHVALEERVSGVVCLGYPLKGAGARAKLRDEVLLALDTPILFVQGTRDPLCPLPLLSEVRRRMQAQGELFVVEGGNHSLEVDKKTLTGSGLTQSQVEERVVETIAQFTATLAR